MITDDGYILTMHRIPHGKSGATSPLGRPVYYQHGIPPANQITLKKIEVFIFIVKDFSMFLPALSPVLPIAH